MRFADAVRMTRLAMRLVAARVLCGALAVILALSGPLSGCSETLEPLSHPMTPSGLTVEAVRLNAVRLTWDPVNGPDVTGYAIERRSNLTGPFVPVVRHLPVSNVGRMSWLDTDVEPETYYGYRVYTVTRFGDHSAASVIGGTKTPPPPGIQVTMATVGPNADAIDPDGYELTMTGPDTMRATIGVTERRRFIPLRPGRYTVALSGVIPRCTVDSSAAQTVDVTDTTAITIVPVTFHVSCRDPKRGDIRVSLSATGGDIDPDYTVAILGEADDATLPPAERVVSQQKTVSITDPAVSFSNLRPGSYDVTIQDIAPNCQLQGTAKRTVQVTALGTSAVPYVVTCVGRDQPPPSGPFVWRNRWSAATAAPGQRVTLTAELDLTARATQKVQGVQADIAYDPAVLRFEVEDAGQLPNLTVNSATPGRISFIAATTSPRSGVVQLAQFEFTVIGAQGTSTTTTTTNLKAGSPTPFQTEVGVQEGTLTVGAGGGTTNQPPTAEANGPYSGPVGSAVSFSSAGSADPDGTIASYAWNFGDNATGSGQSASHAYAAAGSYTVTLTVTDNGGATSTDHATVTITNAGTNNTPPVAEANGPYTVTAGTPVTLSSAGSSDPDGSIASYSWSLGNGQTATGPSPAVTYAAAGTYTVTLTVTDNAGATRTDQATVTVSAPTNTTPLIWQTVFGPVDVANGIVPVTVSYDLRANIAETPGAETLQNFVVDSLKWDSSLLQFSSINLGPSVSGSSNQANVSAGNLAFHGSVSGAQAQGLVTIATIRFKLIGATGAHAVTSTFLGPLQGAPSTNSFLYNSKTQVIEGEIVLP